MNPGSLIAGCGLFVDPVGRGGEKHTEKDAHPDCLQGYILHGPGSPGRDLSFILPS